MNVKQYSEPEESDEQFIERMLTTYRQEIKDLLMEYGDMSKEEAEFVQKPLWEWVKDFTTIESYLRFFHEVPYYWAMDLLYGKENPRWYLDPELWPPPANL